MGCTVTLLICTSGRANQLDRCLQAIATGTDMPEELVVVNGEDSNTLGVVRKFSSAFPEVVLVRHPNRNLAILRNLGLPFCSGEILAMTDDDAVPDSNWIRRLRSAHAEYPQAGAVGGRVQGLSGSFASRVADAVVFPTPQAGRKIVTLPTVNMSYKSGAIHAVGEFDGSLFRGEDVDFNWRLSQAGYQIAFDPDMSVHHEHRRNLIGLYQQQWMYGRAYVLVRRKWPAMYSVYPRSLRTLRSWLKLGHAVLAVLYQPWGVSSAFSAPTDRARAYPVLVLHHLVWKLGMVRQALNVSDEAPLPVMQPRVQRWARGELVEDSRKVSE